jgi:hypothetical protein
VIGLLVRFQRHQRANHDAAPRRVRPDLGGHRARVRPDMSEPADA